VGSNPAGPRGT